MEKITNFLLAYFLELAALAAMYGVTLLLSLSYSALLKHHAVEGLTSSLTASTSTLAGFLLLLFIQAM